MEDAQIRRADQAYDDAKLFSYRIRDQDGATPVLAVSDVGRVGISCDRILDAVHWFR